MQVILSKDAQKQYKHLPETEQKKIRKKLMALEQNPLNGKRLAGELHGIYSIKAWPYRILYGISVEEKRIEIHKIVHRQGAYK